MANKRADDRDHQRAKARAAKGDAKAPAQGRKRRSFGIDELWRVERLGTPSIAPDGSRAVAALTRASMDDNAQATTLWLLSTDGEPPRPLTQAGAKDCQPRWSPRGDLIAFIGKRQQQGSKDDEPQLYVIAPDGGEARRVAVVATGVEAFRWFPDGRRIAFVSWLWPDRKGAKAQAKAMKAWKERKHSGYATSATQYRFWDHHLPEGRVPHLLVVDIGEDEPQVHDLFEGSGWQLEQAEPGADSFDIAPDGTRIVFAHDPATDKRLDNCAELVELRLGAGKPGSTLRAEVIAHDPQWDLRAPRYSPDGARIACLASHQGRKHTMPAQLAVWSRTGPPDGHGEDRGKGPGKGRGKPRGAAAGSWEVVSAEWDHIVEAPLQWEADGQALLFSAEQQGRRPLWRFDLADRRAELVVDGGWVQGFDKAAGTLVTVADSLLHPPRAHAWLPGRPALRIERFNDALFKDIELGRVETRWVQGAAPQEGEGFAGDPLQVWLVYPPGFDAKRKAPLLQIIHGGPHAAWGDSWHPRWNAHVLASRGHVVAMANYHGSTGFGYAFLDSITHRNGELELRDLEAVTDALLAEPWADAQRVFAAGGSYGGYMVAWMNAKLPAGRYAAYVCHAGCFDWTSMFADDCYTWHQKDLGAWYWDDAQRIDERSPRHFAAGLTTPTLVTHGALDYRVPDQQGLAYYNTLKARGIDARLLWFADENHWILKPCNSRQWHDEVFAWLARHDPGEGGKR